MTSLRAWFLPFMVLSMAATGQAQAESTSDTAARGTIEDRPKPAPVVTHADPFDDGESSGAPLAVAPSAIRSRIPVAQQAMVRGQARRHRVDAGGMHGDVLRMRLDIPAQQFNGPCKISSISGKPSLVPVQQLMVRIQLPCNGEVR